MRRFNPSKYVGPSTSSPEHSQNSVERFQRLFGPGEVKTTASLKKPQSGVALRPPTCVLVLSAAPPALKLPQTKAHRQCRSYANHRSKRPYSKKHTWESRHPLPLPMSVPAYPEADPEQNPADMLERSLELSLSPWPPQGDDHTQQRLLREKDGGGQAISEIAPE